MAYFLVHSRAVDSYLGRSVLYTWAISGTKGSSGLGSVSIEHMERSTAKSKYGALIVSREEISPFEIVKAGLH